MLLRSMLHSPHISDPLLSWVKSTYISNGLQAAYASDVAEREEAQRVLRKLEDGSSAEDAVVDRERAEIKILALRMLGSVCVDEEKREAWQRSEMSAKDVKVMLQALVELVAAVEGGDDDDDKLGRMVAEECPVEGLKSAQEAIAALVKDGEKVKEVKRWIVSCLVDKYSPVVWEVASAERLAAICRKEFVFTLHYIAHLFARYRIAWRLRNGAQIDRITARCKALVAVAPWANTLFRELVNKAKQPCFEELKQACSG